MICSKSKTSFAIDDLLYNNNEDQRTSTSAPKPFYNTINDKTVHPTLHQYPQNGNRFSLLSQQIEHFNPISFHHYSRLPTPYMNLPNTFNSMVTMNDFMQFYSQPFNDYWHSGCTFKRKGGQVRFTQQQTQSLEQQFDGQKYLSPEDRKQLAVQLKLSDRQVKTWFQNRRAKWRRSLSIKIYAGTESSVKNLPQDSKCSSSSICSTEFAVPVVDC